MKIKKMLKQGAYQPGFVNPVPDNDIGLTLPRSAAGSISPDKGLDLPDDREKPFVQGWGPGIRDGRAPPEEGRCRTGFAPAPLKQAQGIPIRNFRTGPVYGRP